MFSIFRKRRRVFLSSTSIDLADWRENVAEVLSQSGLTPLKMEEFPAIGKSAAQGSSDMVKRCDLLVGIYARRYGTLVEDGRSVTEVEYDQAKALGLPRICFMLKENAEWPSALVEGESAFSLLQQFKQKVRRDVIVAEFSTLDELRDAAKAAADEYVQKEARQRRIRASLFAFTSSLVLAAFVFFILLTNTKPQMIPVKEFSSPTNSDLNSLAVAQANNWIATGHYNGEVFLWDLKGFTARRLNSMHGAVRRLSFSPSGDRLIGTDSTGFDESRTTCWAVPDGSILWQFDSPKNEGFFSAAAFNRTGVLTAVGSYNGIVTILDREGKVANRYDVPAEEFGIEESRFGLVIDLDFSPDSNSLAVAYQNGRFAVLDLLSGSFLKIGLENDNTRAAHAVCFASNRDLALAAQSDTLGTTFKLWTYNMRNGLALLTEADSIFWRVVPAGRNRFVLSANWSGEVALWNVRNRTKMTSVTVSLGSEEDRILSGLGLADAGIILAITEKKLFVWRLEWRSLGGLQVPWEGNEVW